MPKCVICFDVLPPQLMVPVVTANDPDVQQCVFCEKGIKEVVVENEKSEMVEKYTKEQAKKDYVKFLKMLKEKKGVAEILAKGKSSIII